MDQLICEAEPHCSRSRFQWGAIQVAAAGERFPGAGASPSCHLATRNTTRSARARRRADGPTASAAVAHAAAAVATGELDVVAITCYTETGRTARLLSAERPSCPIYAFIPGEDIRRANTVLWGVTPLPARKPADTDEMIALMDEGLQAFGLAAPGDAVVMAAASPAGKTTTNMLKIHRVGFARPLVCDGLVVAQRRPRSSRPAT